MQIGDIVKLDQKNRLHIPNTLMKEAGIKPNSEVIVYMEVGEECITIRSKKKYDEFQKRQKEVFNHIFSLVDIDEKAYEEDDKDKIKVVEEQDNESV